MLHNYNYAWHITESQSINKHLKLSKIMHSSQINSLAIAFKSSESVLITCTCNKNKLLSLQWVIDVLKNVFILRSAEKDLSAVAELTGNVKYILKILSISVNIPLYISLCCIASAMVLTLVTSLTAILSTRAILIMSATSKKLDLQSFSIDIVF